MMLYDAMTDTTLDDIPLFDDEQTLDDAQEADDEKIEGIAFSLPEGFARRECFILRQALYRLSSADNPVTGDLAHVFRQNEHRIHQIARRLMSSMPAHSPVVISPAALRKN